MTNDTKPEPTIWRVPDDLWEIIEKILDTEYPKASHDRKRVALRPVLDGIIFKLRTGCHWNQIPREFGDDSALSEAEGFIGISRHGVPWASLRQAQDIALTRFGVNCFCDAKNSKASIGNGNPPTRRENDDRPNREEERPMGKARGKSKLGENATGKNPTDRGKKG